MRRWIALTFGSAGVAVVLVAVVMGLNHANERFASDPVDLRDPAHLEVQPPIAEAEPTEDALVQPATAAGVTGAAAAPLILGAESDPASVAYPETMNAAELANAQEWVQTQFITANCMKEQGFDYTFSPSWAGGITYSSFTRIPEDRRDAASEALNGPASRFDPTIEYDWSNAGCWGYAVHVMGNDDKR